MASATTSGTEQPPDVDSRTLYYKSFSIFFQPKLDSSTWAPPPPPPSKLYNNHTEYYNIGNNRYVMTRMAMNV